MCSFRTRLPQAMEYSTNSNVVAARLRDQSPQPRQLGCWSWVGCLGKQKRAIQVVPASRPQDGSGGPTRTWGANGTVASASADQFTGLSPSLLAPPSSPASTANSGNPSSVQSPANFTVSLSVASASVCSPVGLRLDRTATMFTIGPYAHETALVTPPGFSAFTTPPSTAPFTPPPELAHLTTPSSPDVPFAQLLASSLNAKGGMDQCAVQNPASLFTPSDDVAGTEFNRLYPESPITQLVSPNSGASESEPSSPLPGLVSSSQEDNTQIAIDVEQETSVLIVQPVDYSPLNLAFSANNFFPQTLRDTSCMNGSTPSQGENYFSDVYFHLPESHSDRCKPEWPVDFMRDEQGDCQDMGIHLSHAETLAKCSKNILENIEVNTSKNAQCQRDVKFQEESQKQEVKFPDDLFTSYNVDGNAKSEHSLITCFCAQNSLHPATENKQSSDGNFQQEECQWIEMRYGNCEAVAECNLNPSDTCDELGVFELGSKDLKHTLSDKSISFFPSKEKSSFPLENVSGALETSMLDSYLEIPRISFSIAEFLPTQEDEIMDKESDGVFDSSSSGNVVKSLKNKKPSSDCNVFAVALEQTKEVSTSNINSGGILSRYHE